jgi:3-hydroxyisobutyrate dehydrogenase
VRVGFIGIGRLGRHLARSLVRGGFDVTVCDGDTLAVQCLVAAGARQAASPAAAALDADVVITCLPSPASVVEVVSEGDDCVLRAMRSGTWIDMSTNDRNELLRLAGLAADNGVSTLEAPVTGGVHLAASGALTIIVGGDEAVAARHLPLFEAMGSRVFHVGPLGRASDLKVITNMLAFVHLVACGEALMLSARSGVDLAQAFEVIAASSGSSFVHETEAQVILNGSYDIGFTLDLAVKDLGLALERAGELDVPLRLASLVAREFVRARDRFGGDAWSPTVVRLLEEEVGLELRAAGFPATLEPS